jgi:hypothetical protein
MMGIIKKDMLFTLGYLLFLPLMLIYWFATRDALDTTAIFMISSWIYVVTIGSMLGIEVNESKNRGYSFLATLPVSAEEIAAGKLAPVLIQVVVYTAVTYLVYPIFESSPALLDLARNWLLLNSLTALMLTGLVYWLVFRFGFEKAVFLQAIALVLAFLAPIALNELMIRGYLDNTFVLFRIAGTAGSIPMLAAGAVAYFFIYRFSVSTLKRKVPA